MIATNPILKHAESLLYIRTRQLGKVSEAQPPACSCIHSPTFSNNTGSPNWIAFSRVRMYSPPSESFITCKQEKYETYEDESGQHP